MGSAMAAREDEVVLRTQLEALRKRVEELEMENIMLLSRISACSRCSKKMKKLCSEDRLVSVAKRTGVESSEATVDDAGSLRDSSTLVKDATEQECGVGSEMVGTESEILEENKEGYLQMNMKHHGKRYVALKIMYFGQRFYGFASEAHADPTIESEIFKALAKTKLAIGCKDTINYSRCGRTDKGVSSCGQVIALYLRSSLKSNSPSGESPEQEIDYVKLLNRVLPKDIRIMGWCPVPTTFHARFSCLGREYKYYFWKGKMDIEAMQNAAKSFVGEHDFRNFCKMDALNVSNYRRQIITFEVCSCNERHDDDELYAFIIRGSAFLWHQVRCMVAVLFMIGHGLESPTDP